MEPLLDRRDPNTSTSPSQPRGWDLVKRGIFLAVGVVAVLIMLANFIGAVTNILMLVFLCAMIAIGVRGISDGLANHTPLGEKVALALVVIALLALIVGAGVWMGPSLANQFAELGAAVPDAVERLETELRQFSWGEQIADEIPSIAQLGERALMNGSDDVFARITGVVSSALGFLSSIVVVLFVTLFLAIEPKSYSRNFLRLVPVERRDRVREVLRAVHETLGKWLLTRVISLVLVGIITFIGLTLLGMPLILPLTVFAALGSFIPTFGPILALIPAALIALTQGTEQVILVIVLYIGAQAVDNYIVTPIVEKSVLYLPPAYILVAQLVFGVIAGSFGLVLAAPLAAALVVVVRMLYVEDVLERPTEVMRRGASFDGSGVEVDRQHMGQTP
ncbi:MAG: AI-2E family transporter [Chloroflexi bacterium]|nr:AI-2E family transporter [Chloroflexota bacterium]